MLRQTIVAALAFACGSAAWAITPDSYSMLNGNSGSYNYWDQIYNGTGCTTCDNAPLSGGTGDLTDGVIATTNWFVAEAPPGNGPYVGWAIDPSITFHWNAPVSIDSVTFWFDDADGNGGVSAPASVTVNGTNYAISDPPGPAPFAFTASGVSFSGTDLGVQIFRRNGWVFLSEVQFASSVPEPESLALLLAGLSALGLRLVRRRRAAT